MQYETIDADQIKNIMEGRPAGEPKDWHEVDDKDIDKDSGSSVAASDESEVESVKKDDMVKNDLSGDDSGKETESGEPKLH